MVLIMILGMVFNINIDTKFEFVLTARRKSFTDSLCVLLKISSVCVGLVFVLKAAMRTTLDNTNSITRSSSD